MPHEFSRNIQDKDVNPVPFALPAAASASTNSTAIDFGSGVFKPDEVDLDLSVPALNTTILPDTRTATLIIESSTDPAFGSIARTIASKVVTGAGGVGAGASNLRARLPSDCERYVRFKVTFGASTTTGAAVNATGTVRF